jgi:predicted peroxiredoxin
MAKLFVVATHATDDPTKATLAFIAAVGAIGAGKEVTLGLVGESAYLAKAAVANSVHGVGFQPLSELIAKVVEAQVPVYV